jgi:hypothetical protein
MVLALDLVLALDFTVVDCRMELVPMAIGAAIGVEATPFAAVVFLPTREAGLALARVVSDAGTAGPPGTKCGENG